MAITYNTITGDSAMNAKARILRDKVLKPSLKNMKCKTCKIDSVFEFKRHDGYPNSSSVDHVLKACCPTFEREIKDKLGINS